MPGAGTSAASLASSCCGVMVTHRPRRGMSRRTRPSSMAVMASRDNAGRSNALEAFAVAQELRDLADRLAWRGWLTAHDDQARRRSARLTRRSSAGRSGVARFPCAMPRAAKSSESTGRQVASIRSSSLYPSSVLK